MPDKSANDEVPASFKLLHALQEDGKKINLIAWSPDGKMLASAFKAEPIHLWSVDTEKLLQRFEGNFNYCIAWSPNGKMLAAGGVYRLMIWNIETGKLHLKIRTQARSNKSVAWSPDGRILASGSDDGSIILWDIKSGQVLRELAGNSRSVNSVAWSPDGLKLVSGSDDKNVRLWEVETGNLVWMFKGHFDAVNSVAWSSDGEMLASASSDNTIRLWDPKTKSNENTPGTYISGEVNSITDEKLETGSPLGQIGVLQGHTDAVICISFSSDGHLLASKSLDGTIRIWRSDTRDMVTLLNEASLPVGWYAGLAFHPSDPIVATLSEQDTVIRIWELDLASILGETPVIYSVRYTNAKVVLVGDNGVGKTSLSLVLTNKPFVPPESSHGRHVWPFYREKVKVGSGSWELREIFLWDLAGQPNYRLIHQLYLHKATIALVVFDARNETEPFAGVRYWSHALQQARPKEDNTLPPLKKYLVAACIDRGGKGVTQTKIDGLVKELGFERDFRTSAKEGTNIEELAETISGAIELEWNNLPNVNSTDLFERVKNFITVIKKDLMQLSTIHNLYHMFLKTEGVAHDKEHRAEFEQCIEKLESQDLVRRFNFGNHVLLQPELLDAYASALINTVRDEPDGLGTIAEARVLAGNFIMPEDERLEDKEQENLLLIAMVEDLIRYEIALPEQTDDQKYLVFPSLFTIEYPDLPDPEGKAISFDFVGPVQNAYARLVVRFAKSSEFKKKELWKNAAIFTSADPTKHPGTYGLFLRTNGEGRGEFTLFFQKGATEKMRILFDVYVEKHLQKWASSVNRKAIFVCSVCGFVVPNQLVELQLDRGAIEVICPVYNCYNHIPLYESEQRSADASQAHVSEMDRAADVQRELEVAAIRRQGEIESAILNQDNRGRRDMTENTQDYWRPATVFLSYKRENAEEVKYLQQQLKVRGVRAWRDVTDLDVGGPTKEEITRAIDQESDAFVIYITPQSLASDFIWDVEVPVALKRWERDHAFNIIPIFQGVSGIEVNRFCAAHGLRSLTDFNGVSLPDSSTVETKLFNSRLREIAERTLKATFNLRLRRVGADRDRNYEPCICLKTFPYEPSTPSLDLDLDWTDLFKSKDEVPTEEEWEEILFPALQEVKNVLSAKTPSRRLHVFVQANLPAAFTLGFTFAANADFTLLLEGKHGTWNTEGVASDPLPLSVMNYSDNGDAHVAVMEIAISRATAQGVTQSLSSSGLSYKHHIRFELPNGPDSISGVKDASQALAMSHQIGRELRRLCDSKGVSQMHLFAALPAALAVMVGHQFNALRAVTLYHFIPPAYVRVCTLGK